MVLLQGSHKDSNARKCYNVLNQIDDVQFKILDNAKAYIEQT